MAKFPGKSRYTADRGVAMDCNEAQVYLGISTLGHEQGQGPETLALKRHLAECESCHRAFESERRFDHEIARVMSDVATPVGMKDRLKEIVGNAGVPPTIGDPVPTRRLLSRRAVLGFVAAMVPLLVWAWLTPWTRPLTEADVRQLAELDIDALPNASSNVPFPLPAGWDRVRGLQFGEIPRLASAGDRQIPVLPLTVRARSRSPVGTGFLLRLPEFRGQQPVEATSFSSATIQYASFGSWVVWREGNAVYLCVLRDTHTMERLRTAVASSRELT